MSDVLYVLAASCDDVDDALAEYEAIKVAYRHVGSSHDFDATVIAKDAAGKVEIVRGYQEAKRHSSAVGLNWGLAAGRLRRCSPPSASSGVWPAEAAPGRRSGRWPVTRAAG